MTGPDDLLRDLLRDAAPPVDGDASFDDVRSRARRLDRRAARLRIAGAVAVALAVVAVGVPLVWFQPADDEQEVVTAPDPSTSTTVPDDAPTIPPATDEPVGIWPFATGSDADGGDPAALGFDPTDGLATARAFLRVVGGMEVDGVELVTSSGVGDEPARTMVVDADTGARVTEVTLRRLGASARWTVTGASASGLELDPLHLVESPVPVSGRATAFEGTVAVRVVDRSLEPVTLGEGVVTGESGELRPFVGELWFDPGPSGLGAVVAVTHSAEDGTVEQVAAVAVRWSLPGTPGGGEPAPGPALADDEVVAVVVRPGEAGGSHDVVVLGARDGEVRRTLLEGWSAAEGGVLDLAVAPDRRRLYVALSTSACESELRALAVDGSAGAIPLGPGQRVAVSPDGTRMAVTVDPDCDGQDTLEIRGTGGSGGTGTVAFGDGARATTGLPADAEYGPTIHVNALTWLDDRHLVHDVHYEEDGVALQLLAADGTLDRRIGPADDGHLLRLPVAVGAGLRVLAGCCSTDPDRWSLSSLDPMTGERRALHDLPIGVTVIDHAWAVEGPLWLDRDHALHDAAGRVLRRDVALLAA